MRILVVNAGSSSLKLRLLSSGGEVLWRYDTDSPAGVFSRADVLEALATAGRVDAVGHRIVHGGRDFTVPVLIDESVTARLRELTDLAPLHQPKSLAALDAVSAALPEVPAVACFDTAFHATVPEPAATYAVPAEWRERYALRRYGFHGLSHAYAARRAADLLGSAARLVTCHLGAGASLAAVRDGVCVDTTMGFTPLEGLVMATRSGSVDPGLVLWLQAHAGLGERDVAEALEHGSGLLALSGSADMRQVLAREEAGDAQAHLAVEVYLHSLRAHIAAMAAALEGLDVLVFTGGVGENAPAVRARALAGLQFLGACLDTTSNDRCTPDAEVTGPGGHVRVLVIAAREDLEIATAVSALLEPPPGRAGPSPG